MAVGPDGSLYISYYYGPGGRIFKVESDGRLTVVAGIGRSGFSGDGGPAAQARFEAPEGIAVGSDGALYITDSNTYRVRRVGATLPGYSAGDILLASEDGGLQYVFNSQGRHLRTINTITGAKLYEFSHNAAGQLVQITDGDGDVTTIERSAAGLATAIVGPYGQRTALSIDGGGYLISVANPAGETVGLTYAAGGLLSSLTDPRGKTTRFTYDALGRLERETNAGGGFQALTRSDVATSYTVTRTTALDRSARYLVEALANNGRREVTTSPDGLNTTASYNNDGSSSVRTPDGMVVSQLEGADPRFALQAPLPISTTVRTPAGLRLATTVVQTATLAVRSDPLSLTTLTERVAINGRVYGSVYDAASRTFTFTSPAGRGGSTTVDRLGRVIQSQTAGLLPVSSSYDERGRLTSVTAGSGTEARSITFSYNSAGYLATITDPLGRSASFAYDAAGRVTEETLPGGRVIAYAYDANGNLTAITPPGRPAHQFTYTALDQAASYTAPDAGGGAPRTEYSYNADRQLTRVARPDGTTVDMSYDAAGRLTGVTSGRGQLAYAYNATSGNLERVTAPDGGTLSYTYDGALPTGVSWAGAVAGSVGYSYDNDLRITATRVNGTNSISYQYDADSLLVQAGDLTLARNAQNGLLTGSPLGGVGDSWAYNGFAEPTAYNASAGASTLYSVQYSRDALGRIVTKAETIGGATTTYSYSYDAAGRLVEVRANGATVESYSYDGNGNRTSATVRGATANGSYDAQDRLLSYGGATYAYSASGELQSKTSGGQTTTYQYDELGSLLAVGLPGGTQVSYVIDGAGRRIGRRVNGTLTQGWLYDGQLRPIVELDGAGNIISRYVYATRVNVPDYMIKGGATYRIIADHLGSPRLVVDTATGAIAQRLDYDAFGIVLQDSNPGFQPFGFAGGLYDPQTKLVRFGARDYDAEIGRWTAKDPIGFAGGDANLYAYVGGDGVNLIDLTGHGYWAQGPLVVQGITIPADWLSGPDANQGNYQTVHEHYFLDNGGNIGFGTRGGPFDKGVLFNLTEQEARAYKRTSENFDDTMMLEAITNVYRQNNQYSLVSWNCQSFAEAARREYYRLLKEQRRRREQPNACYVDLLR